jgi:glycosyltransferase involved in cell wall biosynthesis
MSQWLARSFIKDFGVNENKVIPVGAGINLPYILDTTNRDYHSKRILMVGKDFIRKGGDTLLSAFVKVKKEVPDAELRIIGPHLENIPDGVTCTGFLSKNNSDDLSKLLKEYRNARVFVIPSLYEPFGISFVEAMAHRLPCIGTNICAMPEIIRHNSTGFVVPPKDDKTLSKYIIDLLKSETQCKEMGNAGYEHYKRNYTWEIVTNKIINHIDSLN